MGTLKNSRNNYLQHGFSHISKGRQPSYSCNIRKWNNKNIPSKWQTLKAACNLNGISFIAIGYNYLQLLSF